MSGTRINEEQIVVALRQVPTEQWPKVLRYLESLRVGTTSQISAAPIRTATDLAGSDLIGIWSERSELPTSQEFARELRQRAEHRQG